MFTTIIEWLVFLVVAGIIAYGVGLVVYAVYMIIAEESPVNAVLSLASMFGVVFFVVAPFVFNGVIPANNWGMLICFISWLVGVPASIMLGTWTLERK